MNSKIIFRVILSMAYLSVVIAIPLYFENLLFYLAGNLALGWSFSTILLRLLVVLFFAFALRETFSLFKQTKQVKFGWIFLISLLPGIFIPFIWAPIYNIDFGYFNDGKVMPPAKDLTNFTSNQYQPTDNYELFVFLTPGCPHCAYSTRKLGATFNEFNNLKINLFFDTNHSSYQQFLKKNNGERFDSYLMESESFYTYSGAVFPSIYLTNKEGQTLYHWTGDEMNNTALDYLIDLNNQER
jgi:thioredoxin-related protein